MLSQYFPSGSGVRVIFPESIPGQVKSQRVNTSAVPVWRWHHGCLIVCHVFLFWEIRSFCGCRSLNHLSPARNEYVNSPGVAAVYGAAAKAPRLICILARRWSWKVTFELRGHINHALLCALWCASVITRYLQPVCLSRGMCASDS